MNSDETIKKLMQRVFKRILGMQPEVSDIMIVHTGFGEHSILVNVSGIDYRIEYRSELKASIEDDVFDLYIKDAEGWYRPLHCKL